MSQPTPQHPRPPEAVPPGGQSGPPQPPGGPL